MDHSYLLTRIEAYCRLYRISETTFGARCLNNSKFVAGLRGGGNLTLRTLHRVDAFMLRPTGAGRQKDDGGGAVAHHAHLGASEAVS